MLNCDWLLGGEAVDASLGYSSRIWVAGWFQLRFQLRPDDDDAPSSVYGVSFSGEACGVLLREVDSLYHYFLEGLGAGSGIQLRWLSRGGRVTLAIVVFAVKKKIF